MVRGRVRSDSSMGFSSLAVRALEPPFWWNSNTPPYAEIDEHDLDDGDSRHLIIETADGLIEFAVGTTRRLTQVSRGADSGLVGSLGSV